VNTVMNLRVPQKAGSFLTSWVTISFSIRTLLRGYIYLVSYQSGVSMKHYYEIELEWILRKQDGGCGLDSSGSGQGPLGGCCEHGNEPPGSIKGGEFLD